MAKPTKPSYWCTTLTEGYIVKCCMFVEENGELEKYCIVCADTNPQTTVHQENPEEKIQAMKILAYRPFLD